MSALHIAALIVGVIICVTGPLTGMVITLSPGYPRMTLGQFLAIMVMWTMVGVAAIVWAVS